MNIVLINHYAGSNEMGMEFRPYYMAREWIKKGHKVYIIAGDYSHLRKKNPVVEKDFTRQNIDGVEYIWVKTGTYDGNGVKRAMSMFRFVSKLWLQAKNIAKRLKLDIVIASSTYPLDTFAAQKIRRYSGASYIHEIHDMWPVAPMELSNMSKGHPFIVAMQFAENSFCKNADKVVSILPAADQYLVQHGMKQKKFASITNGIVLDDWKVAEKLDENCEKQIKKIKSEHSFVIGFFGSHTKSYALEYLIAAIRKINRKEVAAVFVGDGIDKKKLIQQASDLKDNIYFLPVINKKAIPTLTEYFDCIYVGAMHSTMFRFGISMNKLFDAMMSGKPILYAVDAPNNYIKEYQCGVSVETEDADALVQGILELLEMPTEKRYALGENGRKAVIQNFQYEVLSERFLDVMQELRKRG